MQQKTFNIDDLNNQLYNQLVMMNTDLSHEDLKAEVSKAKAMVDIGSVILEGKRIQLEAFELVAKGQVCKEDLVAIIDNGIKKIGND